MKTVKIYGRKRVHAGGLPHAVKVNKRLSA